MVKPWPCGKIITAVVVGMPKVCSVAIGKRRPPDNPNVLKNRYKGARAMVASPLMGWPVCLVFVCMLFTIVQLKHEV